MDECSKTYTPENIADTMLEKTRERNAFFDQNGIDEEALKNRCEKEWESKQSIISREIEKLNEKIGFQCDHSELRRKVIQFESLVRELNTIYKDLGEEKEKYDFLKNDLSEIVREKAMIREKLQIEKEHSSRDERLIKQYRTEFAALDKRESKDRDQLARNRYETLSTAYRRKMQRYEKLRKEFTILFSPCDSVLVRAHELKDILVDMDVLQKQMETNDRKKQEEIAAIGEECRRKKEIWNLTQDLREEWIHATEDQSVKEDVEQLYMYRVNAVFATCSGIASAKNGRFANMEYDYCIIDEAAKCNKLDLLIPVTMGKKIVLVGDHKQLYPMLETEEIKDKMTLEEIQELKNDILFKEMYEKNVPDHYKIMLDRQYRMRPLISGFVSEQFYNGALKCEKDSSNESSMIWIDSEDAEEVPRGKSFENPKEARIIVSLLKTLDEKYGSGTEVGVICTYKSQANYIKSLIKDRKWVNIQLECSTVDAFQGKEKHTIIFNIVRSKSINSFVRDENRVNVAVSRAQEALYVVGNADLMKRSDAGVLSKLYDYIREKGETRNSRYMR